MIEEKKREKLVKFLALKFEISEESIKLKSEKKRNEEYFKFLIKRGFKNLFKRFKKN